jgi:hypothetical protein
MTIKLTPALPQFLCICFGVGGVYALLVGDFNSAILCTIAAFTAAWRCQAAVRRRQGHKMSDEPVSNPDYWPGRPGVRKIAAQLGVNASTVQQISSRL